MSNTTGVKTILILAANPASTARLRLDAEVRSIEEALQHAPKGGQFRLVQKGAVRSRDFYLAILEHQPQIVHFCGHGTGVNGIVLEDDTGQPTLVDQETLSQLFKLFAVKGVECVVLNACYSSVQAEAISQYIQYVVGMNQTIGDKAAIAFAVAFYDALGAGETVEFAFNLGRTELIRLKEDQIPVLKTTSIHPADIQFEAGDIPPNPYLGLSAFGEKDTAFFFGREKFTDELFRMTNQQPMVAVIGASGSGKSSVVFAGLIPKLREKGIWLIESLRPKSQPFDELALALVRQLEPNLDGVDKVIKVSKLAESLKKGEVKLHQVASQILENKSNKRFLLVVDQFEELYTQCQDKQEQQRFIDTLLATVSQKSITLVFTLRADFYGYVLSYLPFCEALQQFKHTPLGLMRREELQAAIEQPAQKLNVKLQTYLAERILDDIGNEPGNLPLLEFALTQLWDNQKNGEMTHRAYDEIGGLKQALVKHAEQVYSRLSQSQQQQTQRVFLALVRLGEATKDTRRVATHQEIGSGNWELVTHLASSEARLVVTGRNDKSGEETVEVVHEVLIREWKRLRKWISINRDKLIQHRKIEAAATEWRDKGKSKDYLLAGKQLNEAKAFQKEQASLFALSALASELIQKSIEYRWNNRLRLSSFGLLPLLALTVFSGFATIGQRNAQIEQIKAFEQASDAEWRSNQDFEAVIDALRAGKALDKLLPFGLFKPDAELARVRGTLQKVVYTERVKEFNRLEEDYDLLASVVFSPDGQTIAVGSTNKSVTIWSLEGIKLQTLTGHDAEVKSVAFSPDSQTIATASDDKTVKLWKRNNTGQFNTQPEQTLTRHSGGVKSVAFSPDGQTIATASDDKTVKLWKRNSTGQFNTQPEQTLTGHDAGVKSVAFSPDGQTIATASEDSTVKLWSIEGQELQTLTGHDGEVTSVAFSPDGLMLVASANLNGTIKLWKRNSTGQFETQPDDITPGVYIRSIRSVAFSPVRVASPQGFGQMLALATEDKTVILVNLQGQVLQTLTGHTGWVSSVAFSPDKKTLTLASSTDRTVKLWRFEGKKLPTLSNVHERAIWRIAISPNGEMLASASIDGTVKLWKWDSTGQFETQPYKTLIGHRNWVWSVAFSPDGKTIATASDDKTVKLWSIEGEELQTLTGHDGGVKSVAFSPDSKTIATASDDKTVKLWKRDDSTGEFVIQPYKTLTGHNGKVFSVAFSPDGQTIATASDDNTVKLWNLDRSQVLRTLTGHKGDISSVVFSPNGQVLASASFDGSIKLWKRGFTGQFETQAYKTLTGHTTWVTSVVFSPDGQMLASASEDTTVKLWTLEGKELQTLYGHGDRNWIRSIVFSLNGKKIVSAGAGKVILWNLEDFSLDKLMQPACNWVQNYLKNNPNVSQSDRRLCDN
ncbi:CHAT domain-containing protein [Brasilonema bromeliae]|uniref:CHAT domain-containing protein n=1 Tax=Brasilonema bromeliae SPC951 TaxID=385972 RepID=A0ABX1P9Z8_9CYAN|nr:CHAT domain-containing protein [Brasilonema bromeliae]NMG21267.1 hypothetical protein [Brasilonema bromeliae SPC951]